MEAIAPARRALGGYYSYVGTHTSTLQVSNGFLKPAGAGEREEWLHPSIAATKKTADVNTAGEARRGSPASVAHAQAAELELEGGAQSGGGSRPAGVVPECVVRMTEQGEGS